VNLVKQWSTNDLQGHLHNILNTFIKGGNYKYQILSVEVRKLNRLYEEAWCTR